MINLEFLDATGERIAMAYDVHPLSQEIPLAVPPGAVKVIVWLGTRPANMPQDWS